MYGWVALQLCAVYVDLSPVHTLPRLHGQPGPCRPGARSAAPRHPAAAMRRRPLRQRARAQELLAAQLIRAFADIFAESGLPLQLRPYEVLVTSNRTALIELVPDSLSVHQARGGRALRLPGLCDVVMRCAAGTWSWQDGSVARLRRVGGCSGARRCKLPWAPAQRPKHGRPPARTVLAAGRLLRGRPAARPTQCNHIQSCQLFMVDFERFNLMLQPAARRLRRARGRARAWRTTSSPSLAAGRPRARPRSARSPRAWPRTRWSATCCRSRRVPSPPPTLPHPRPAASMQYLSHDCSNSDIVVSASVMHRGGDSLTIGKAWGFAMPVVDLAKSLIACAACAVLFDNMHLCGEWHNVRLVAGRDRAARGAGPAQRQHPAGRLRLHRAHRLWLHAVQLAGRRQL